MADKTCVVYILNMQKPHLHDATLAAAQARALQYKLPLAAIFALEEWDVEVLDALRHHETYLKNHNIPLIVLVGERYKVIPGFLHHTKPIAVFDQPVYGIGLPELSPHPHAWPGVVIDINGLIELQVAGKITC